MKLFDRIKASFEEAIEIAAGRADPSTYVVHHVSVEPHARRTSAQAVSASRRNRKPSIPVASKVMNVRVIREKLGLTQSEFAKQFGFNLRTLQYWEQGRHQPRGVMRSYLKVIGQAPDTVRKAIRTSK